MKILIIKYLIPATIIAILAYFVSFLGFIFGITILLSILFLIIAGLILLIKLMFKKQTSYSLFKIPFFIICFSLLGLIVVFLSAPAPIPTDTQNVSKELEFIYKLDQEDRQTLRFLDMRRDKKRVERVLYLYSKDSINKPQDKFYAAIILQHGNNPEHYKLAHNLANQAKESNIEYAEWLSKATYDRWMLSIGKEQKYGTQKGFYFDKK